MSTTELPLIGSSYPSRLLIRQLTLSRSSVSAVQAHDTKLLKKLAEHFNLSYTAFGAQVSEQDAPAYGSLTISDAWGGGLEPAPISPIDAPEYALLSGTIKATYNAHRSLTGDDNVVVVPGIMSGNTGACHFSSTSGDYNG